MSFTVAGEDVLPDIVRHLVESGANVYGVARERTSLEEMFVDIMGEDPGL
jgi:hypothetical protein